MNQNALTEQILTAIEQVGYVLLDGVFDRALIAKWRQKIITSDAAEFRSAGIGRAHGQQQNSRIRGDEIKWLEPSDPALAAYFSWAEQLRSDLNQHFYLGLSEYECHLAHYPSGAHYQRHVDAFRGSQNRKISTVLYLNEDWQETEGGELLLYQNAADNQPLERISPVGGRLVIFLSEEFPHEVLPAKRSRYSLTGWFRVQG